MSFDRRNFLDVLLIPACVAAFAALGWWAVYAGPDSADKIEARLQGQVEQALGADMYDWASARVDGQTVILTGEAPTEALQARASRSVLEASGRGGWLWGGVKSVENETSVAAAVADYVFGAALHDGEVSLSGVLPGVNARDRLVERLNREGYQYDAIIDETRFAAGVPDGDWVGAADLGLSQLVRLTDAELELDGKHLFLRGQAPNAAVRLQVLQRMTRPPSGYTADVDLTGTAVWSAQISGDRLTLSGAVPDANYRTELVELAARFFDGEIVNSQIIRPMEDAQWLSAMRTVLPNFLQFRSGEIAYMGDQLTVRGKASQSVIDFLREDSVRVGTLADLQLILEPIQVKMAAFDLLEDGAVPDHKTCVSALNEALGWGDISFRYGSETLNRESGVALDGVESVLRTCPDEVLLVDAYTHVEKRRIAPIQLTEARQRAISDYFIARGVPLNQVQLTKIEAGESSPVVDEENQKASQIRMRLKE